jgi:hypothetical protein
VETIQCRYGTVDVRRCVDCIYSAGCSTRSSYLKLKHQYWQDRGPDASTNDFIYGRGEFDPILTLSKHEISSCAGKFRQITEKVTLLIRTNPDGARRVI